MRALTICTTILLGVLYFLPPAVGQTQAPNEQALEAGRAALRQKNYAEAIQLLSDGLKRFPNDRNLKLELGRAYLYDRQDQRAIQLFKEILREDPSNRAAKLELGRALGYHRNFDASNRLYRDLLKDNPDDEAAAAGLIRNLMHQHHTAEARQELDRALARHPNSQRLQEYKQRLEQPPGRKISGGPDGVRSVLESKGWKMYDRIQGSAAYFSDSAGNRSWRSWQQFDYAFSRNLGARMELEERRLSKTNGPSGNVYWGSGQMRLPFSRWLLVAVGGGGVRFPDGSSRALYRGEFEIRPARQLLVTAGFLHSPVAPTAKAAGFNLVADDWHTYLDWYSRSWQVNARLARQHYSDSNHAWRASGEVLRWIGGPSFAIGAGYRLYSLSFSQSFAHGYFDPSKYWSHMGITGVRFRFADGFRGEYVARIGGESIGSGPFRTAWDVAARNRYTHGNWQFAADYLYFRLAQSSGAFRAQAGRVGISYTF